MYIYILDNKVPISNPKNPYKTVITMNVKHLALIFLGFYLMLQNEVNAQEIDFTKPPDVVWLQSFGGLQEEVVYEVMPTVDGGYIVAGHTYSKGAGGADIWLLKLDPEGNKKWEKTVGGEKDDFVRDIVRSDDGGYLLLGNTESKGAGNTDFWVVKVDGEGLVKWNKTFGSAGSEKANALVRLRDNNYLLVGTKHVTKKQLVGKAWKHKMTHSIWMIKIDRAGNEIWNQTIDSEHMVTVTDVFEAANEDFVIVANTRFKKSEFEDGWLIRTDLNGTVLWDKVIGEKKRMDMVHAVQPLSDGSIVLAGIIMPKESRINGNGWLVKVNEKGKVIWDTEFGGRGSDEIHGLATTSDGGILLTGTSGSSANGSMWLIKTDEKGKKIWERTCGESLYEKAEVVMETFDGDIIVIGNSVTRLKANPDGTMPSWEEGEKIYGDMKMVRLSYY